MNQISKQAMHLRRINTLRRLTLTYFDEYTLLEENPTMEGFLDYATTQEELDNELEARDKQATEDSLRQDL